MFSISFNRLENCNPNHGTCPNSELLETVSDFVIDGKVSLTSHFSYLGWIPRNFKIQGIETIGRLNSEEFLKFQFQAKIVIFERKSEKNDN